MQAFLALIAALAFGSADANRTDDAWVILQTNVADRVGRTATTTTVSFGGYVETCVRYLRSGERRCEQRELPLQERSLNSIARTLSSEVLAADTSYGTRSGRVTRSISYRRSPGGRLTTIYIGSVLEAHPTMMAFRRIGQYAFTG